MATGRIGTTPVLTTRWSKAPSAGTTSLSGLDDNSVSLVYSVGYEAVYQNGVLLSRGNDYTATNGTTITLTTATVAGDIIEVFANQTIPLTDTYSQTVSDGRFIKNTLTTTTGDIIYASAANTPARLGIGSTSQVLTVSGGVPTWSTPADSWTLLNTGGTSLSGSSNTRIQSLSGSYQMLHIFIQDATCASLNDFSVRFNNDSGSNYFTAQRFRYSDSTSNDITSTNGTSASLGSVQNGDAFIYISVPNYANTSTWKVAHIVACRNDVINGVQAGGILWKSTSAINEFDVISGANLTGGTCYIYGEK